MKITFETIAKIEGVEDFTEEQRAAVLEQIVGHMIPSEIGAWIAASRWRESMMLGADDARDRLHRGG